MCMRGLLDYYVREGKNINVRLLLTEEPEYVYTVYYIVKSILIVTVTHFLLICNEKTLE